MVGREPGKLSLRALASEMGMDVKNLKLRAAAAGLAITTSIRRIGEQLTHDVLAALAAEGLTLTEEGKRVGRDYRTMVAAAAAHNVAFPTRATKVAGARQAKAVQAMTGRQAAADERQAKATVARAAREAVLKAAHEALGARRATARPVALHDAACRRVAAVQPKVVHVMAAPAPVREAMPTEVKPARRWNSGPIGSGRPKVVLIQTEVDAAVARFIAERGVTRPAASNPLEAAVTEARRMGFSVLRDGDGFVLDNRIRFAGLPDLQEFVRQREGRLARSA